MDLPRYIETESELDEVMTTPSPALVEAMSGWRGDLLILGVAGKMGPTLARLARRALDQASVKARVIGVARFSNPQIRDQLESHGIETLTADLLADAALQRLPDVPNVLHLVAQKFGSTGNEPMTWALNTYLPARVADRYRRSRIVALSTGNVYPFTPASGPGPTESDPVGPVGEYAHSCLGRERMFQYFSGRYGTPVSLIRLNYAIDLRYGVLLDLASKVRAGEPIDLSMGHVNVIWQADANTAILRSFAHCASPPFVLNLTGPRTLSIRDLAGQFGRLLGREPIFAGAEAPTALLSNARRCLELMGPPRVSVDQLVTWVAHWLQIAGPTLGKPTHFQTRNGHF